MLSKFAISGFDIGQNLILKPWFIYPVPALGNFMGISVRTLEGILFCSLASFSISLSSLIHGR